jgi:hypothetical protein
MRVLTLFEVYNSSIGRVLRFCLTEHGAIDYMDRMVAAGIDISNVSIRMSDDAWPNNESEE